MAEKLTSIRFKGDNADFVETLSKTGGSITDYANKAIELKRKFDKGELVEVNTLLKGQSSDTCIFGLKDVDPLSSVANAKCPVKEIYPELKKAENGEELQKFCAKCPWRDHDKVLFKLKSRYPSLFREQLETAEQETIIAAADTRTPIEQKQATSDAREAATASKQLLKVAPPRPPHKASDGKTPHWACDSCNFEIWQDNDAQGLEDKAINHVSTHERVISQNEINQLRHAQRKILGAPA